MEMFNPALVEKAKPKFEVELFTHGRSLTLKLDQRHATAATLLPVLTRLFSKDKSTVVEAKTLFKRVGGGYQYGAWLKNVKVSCRLDEGIDFFSETLAGDTVEELKAIKRGEGSLTYFTLKAARKITARSKTDEGHALLEFLDALAEAIVPSFLDQLIKKDAEITEHRREVCTLVDENRALALRQGYKSATDFTMKNQETKALKKAQTDAADHGAVAVEFWEYSTRALKALRAKDVPKAMTHLSYLTERFGEYDDLNRHEPPWQSSLWQ